MMETKQSASTLMRLTLLSAIAGSCFSPTLAETASEAAWVSVSDATDFDHHPAIDQKVDDSYTRMDTETHCDGCGSCHCECYGVDPDPGFPRKPRRTMPGDRNRGDCPPLRYRMDDQKRSGSSSTVAPWATCGRRNTPTGHYSAWFVGGGAVFDKIPTLPLQLFSRGRNRKSNACGQHAEGTWGLDYEGLGGYAKVWLKYTQGRKQGGEGRYETDGEPELLAKIKEALHR